MAQQQRDQDLDPLEYELQESRAAALGAAGKKVEKALDALAACNVVRHGADQGAVRHGADQGARELLLDAAANAVWELLITRESLKFYDHAIALAYFNIPDAVMARVGVVKR
ncbi:MAG TPA: DUF6665 family protein, partial [Kofleriaceae bacterium]|nr:DUF6665 family protein [Kofleriaceae bacterium]